MVIALIFIFLFIIIIGVWLHFVLVSIYHNKRFQALTLIVIPLYLLWEVMNIFRLTTHSRELDLERNIKEIVGVGNIEVEELESSGFFSPINFAGSFRGKYHLKNLDSADIISHDFINYFPSFIYANHKWKRTFNHEYQDLYKFINTYDEFSQEIKDKLESSDCYFAYKEGDAYNQIEYVFLFDPNEMNLYIINSIL